MNLLDQFWQYALPHPLISESDTAYIHLNVSHITIMFLYILSSQMEVFEGKDYLTHLSIPWRVETIFLCMGGFQGNYIEWMNEQIYTWTYLYHLLLQLSPPDVGKQI